MLKGDLATTTLEAVLTGIAAEQSTGCLHVSDPDGEEALVYFKNGLVYAVSVPGRRPQLGARLISSGALAPEGLAEALEAQRDELQGWRLGELLVHLGFVDHDVVAAFGAEALRDAMTDLIRWQVGRWKFRKGERTREDVAPPAAVSDLLVDVRARVEAWQEVSETVHGPNAVPHLSTRTDSAAEMTLDPDAWSLLCKIDGDRSVAELARDCGFTLLEAGRVILSLVQAGLVDLEEDVAPTPPALALVPEQSTADDVDPAAIARSTADDVDPAAIARSLAAAFSHDPEPEPVPPITTTDEAETRVNEDRTLHRADDFTDSIARVSQALSDLLGPSAGGGSADALFEVPEHLRVGRVSQPEEDRADREPTEEELRRERVRAAAAEELANAHATAEEQRRLLESGAVEPAAGHLEEEPSSEAPQTTAEETPDEANAFDDSEVASVVQLSRRRRSKRKQAQAEARRAEEERLAAAAEAARVAAELEEARLAEDARLAEEAEEARLSEEAELARLAEEARLSEEAELARLAEEASLADEALLASEAEHARLAEDAAVRAAVTALTELTASPPTDFFATAPPATPEPVAEPMPVEASAPVEEPVYSGPREATDTAALLRELSSLGLDDEAPGPSGPVRPAASKTAPKAPPKKRKGLFGRS